MLSRKDEHPEYLGKWGHQRKKQEYSKLEFLEAENEI